MAKKKTPLMKMNVIHVLPGRIRVHIRALKYLKDVSEDIKTTLCEHHAIKACSLSPITGNILIHFNGVDSSQEEVLGMVDHTVGLYALMAYQKEREEESFVEVEERRLQEESTKIFIQRIAITSASLIGFTLLGHHKRMPQTLLKSITSPPALMSLGLSTDIIKSGVESVKNTRRPNADTLTMAAIVTAILTGRSMSALMTILLSDIAELMTAYTMERTRAAIGDMLSSDDETVFKVEEDGSLSLVPVTKLEIGDVVSVQAGEKLHVDGSVVDGQGFIDQSAITGEYFPAKKDLGETVYAGTVLKVGALHVKTEKVGDATTVSRIVHMVEDAASKKAKIQSYADKFSAKLIPLNFGLAVGVYLFTGSINRALSMMIIDYSCGVRLSTATALSASIHNAARNGVLIKGGNYIESLALADSVVLDKTGTMTEGKPRVISIKAANGVSEQDLIEYAAAAEEDSSHPLAHAIMSYVKQNGYTVPKHGITETLVGQGVATQVGDVPVHVGNIKLMHQEKIDLSPLHMEIKRLERRGESIIYIAIEGKLGGIIGIHDALKENMKKALNRLRFLGFDDIRLLTGDVDFQAEKMAVRMNMDDFEAELLPEDKAHNVLQMQSAGAHVMMIGDGINDAPALAYADVGVAIGNTRTDIAIESADITVTNDDPLLIPSSVLLARKTMKIIKENFGAVIGINSIGIALSAIGVLPVFWSSVLHNSSTILVVLNSGRLLIHDFERRLSN